MRKGTTALTALLMAGATALAAQTPPAPPAAPPAAARPPAVPRVAASSRAMAEVLISMRNIGGNWVPAAAISGPARIAIEYGQPHARGRAVFGDVVPFDTAWRSGANVATHLTTEVDLTIGDKFVPRGVYTLFSVPSRSGWQLVISRQVFVWGTDYDPKQDFGRVALRTRTLREPLESLTWWLVPNTEEQGSTRMPNGVLKLAWGTMEGSVDWRVGR